MVGVVMVPLDGSALSEQALPLAVSLAQRIKRGLLLVQVIPRASLSYLPRSEVTPLEFVQAFEVSSEGYLRQVKEQLEGTKAGSNVPISISIIKGDAEQAIADLANDQQPSVIVMSTHGRSGLSRWVLGSVADGVLHLTTRPLILIRPDKRISKSISENHDLKTDLLDQLPKIKRIVVPLDDSFLAKQVLPHVKNLARLYNAEILLFHALTAQPMLVDGWTFKKDGDQIVRDEVEAHLKRMVLGLQIDGYRADFAIGLTPAAEAILAYAATVDADMIAMTTHARAGINRLILGSVTDSVVQGSRLPILITKLQTILAPSKKALSSQRRVVSRKQEWSPSQNP